jgi:hypothetical protein
VKNSWEIVRLFCRYTGTVLLVYYPRYRVLLFSCS